MSLTEGNMRGADSIAKESTTKKRPKSPPPPMKKKSLSFNDHVCDGNCCANCMKNIELADYYGDMAREEEEINEHGKG